MKMIAREMFESLGYKYGEESDERYNYKVIKYYDTITEFVFSINAREFAVSYCEEPKYITVDEFKAIQQQLKELGWTEEEKTEMNIEHYFDDLTKFGVNGFAVVNGEVTSCAYTYCSECIFNRECNGKNRLKWLASQHKKLVYKLNQFEFDIIQTYHDCHESCKFSEFRQLIELKNKGYFRCVDDNTNIQYVLNNCEVIK